MTYGKFARSIVGLLGLQGCLGSVEPADGMPGVGPAVSDVRDMHNPTTSGAGGGPAAPGASAGANPNADPNACQARGIAPGPSPLRRLTRFEYNNTVRDLLGDTSAPADGFPAEVGGNAFGNDADSLSFERLQMEQYYAAASRLSGAAVADAKVLASLLGGCDAAKSGSAACAAAFIDGFGQRAYRRPLDQGEKDRLMAVFTATSAGADFKTGVTAVLRTMLQAPQFLYRVEVGTPVAGNPAVRKVEQYEMAARLSYLLWSTMPDAELFAAAKAGKLGTRDEVLAQGRRMLADPRARDVAAFFHRIQFKLVGLETLAKDATVFPAYKPGTGALLAQEAARFLDHVVWDGEGDLATILTAPYSFMNADLAKFYGVTGPKTASFEKVALDPTQRAGLITQAGLMALLTPGSHTNPVRRGYYVRERLFCTPPPAPPASLMVKPPVVDKNASTRDSFAAHSQDPACSGCHVLLDPIGFALEKYDGAGLWRTTENGKTIDARGDLVGTDVAGAFDGPVELARKLAASDQVRACYVAQWFQFAQGRAGSADDACAVASLAAAFAKPGAKIKDLLLGLTQTDAFLYRPGGQP